ncbi:HD domain-containing protein [Nitratiruptor sp. YY09-18]|uniref:HD domain-containing protein n=1 Tax=Nitratiruptor sp. YY09-18 TaxID=2724901 RepID=UPI00191671EB|nr:HD domain-containing protein [Nitratiruptor sp. YY09-18]BCD68483.1 CRISPR-associated protein Csm1 [Nitratiruptor sp. YY09-18]
MRDIDLMALAGLLHDIGKFGQRAEIPLREPFKSKNYGYKHSAYTAQILQDYFNDLQNYHQYAYEHHIVNENSDENSWIIAAADRMASGFERETFENYNKSVEFKDFKKQRLKGLFDETKEYKIDKLSPHSIFYAEEKSDKNEYIELWEYFEKDLKTLQKLMVIKQQIL